MGNDTKVRGSCRHNGITSVQQYVLYLSSSCGFFASCGYLPPDEERPHVRGGRWYGSRMHTSRPPSRRNTAWHHHSHPTTHRASAHAMATPDPRPAPPVSYVSVHRAVVSPERSASLLVLVLVLEAVDTKPT